MRKLDVYLAQCRYRVIAGDELSDLVAYGLCNFQHSLVARADLPPKKLHDAVEFAAYQDRECERRVQSRLQRRLTASQRGLFSDVGDPHRCVRCPHLPIQPAGLARPFDTRRARPAKLVHRKI